MHANWYGAIYPHCNFQLEPEPGPAEPVEPGEDAGVMALQPTRLNHQQRTGESQGRLYFSLDYLLMKRKDVEEKKDVIILYMTLKEIVSPDFWTASFFLHQTASSGPIKGPPRSI